jgi:hypothetical protein
MGLLSSDLTIESPFNKGNGSIIMSGRRAYLGVIRSIVNQLDIKTDRFFKDNQYYFYDLNAKVSYRLTTRDRLYLSAYYGMIIRRWINRVPAIDPHEMGQPAWQLALEPYFNHAFSANQTIGYTGYDFYLDASFNKYGFHLRVKLMTGIIRWIFYSLNSLITGCNMG